MLILSAFACGLIFGLGLILGGMTNPANVIGFLDLAGDWNPSLALVMGGAVMVATGAFFIARQRATSLLGAPMQLPTNRDLDPRLIIGSALFGAGWGLGGFCPGPAIVALGAGMPQAVTFVTAMLVGMLAFEVFNRFLQRPATPARAHSH